MKSMHAALGALILTPFLAFADDLPAPAFDDAGGMPSMMHHMRGGPHGGPMGGPGMGMEGGHMMGPLRALNLDEAQKDKIFAIHHGMAPALRNAAKALHQSHQDLRKLATSGKFDEARAKALADAGAKAGAEIALLHARAMSQVYGVLTDAQKKQLEEMKARRGGMRGMSGGPGMPNRK